MRRAVFLLLLALCSCGRQPDDVIVVQVVDGYPNDASAYAHWGGDGPSYIDVSEWWEAWPGDFTDAVIAHELVHASTRTSGHLSDPSCFVYGEGLPEPWHHEPCPDEVAAVNAAWGPWRVECGDDGLLPHVRWAVEEWNDALGREAFLLAP